MAYERSELTFAAALSVPLPSLRKIAKGSNKEQLSDFLDNVIIPAAQSVTFADKATKQGFISSLKLKRKAKLTTTEEKHNNNILSDLLRGVSAAIAMKEYLSAELGRNASGAPRVYMTGTKWPEDIARFNISGHGLKNYNSTDVMLTFNGRDFHGVSLKKKDFPNTPDPTLINKSFSQILNTNFSYLLETLEKSKKREVAKIVISAVNTTVSDSMGKPVPILNCTDMNRAPGIKFTNTKDFNVWANTERGMSELHDSEYLDEEIFGRDIQGKRMKYINVRGWSGSSEKKPYQDENTRNPNSMRYFVNRQLSNPNAEIWTEYTRIINQYAQPFAEILITTILKDQLYDDLKRKNIDVSGNRGVTQRGTLQQNGFSFYLCTGTGIYNPSSDKGSVSSGQVTPLKTILCGLTRVKKEIEKSPYRIVIDEVKNSEREDSAILFLKLEGGNTTILELELRFKGSFTSSPQFQAFIHPEFKTLLNTNCG